MSINSNGESRLRALLAAFFFSAASLAGAAAPPVRFTVSLGAETTVPNLSPTYPNYQFFPDGHIPRLTDGAQFMMFWANSTSYRSTGSSVIQTMSLSPSTQVLGPGAAGSYDNGGAWLYSVHRLSGQNLVGFYHAEDHEWPGYPNPNGIAWKSVATATSADNGVSWTKLGQILTSSATKPAAPTFGGGGDHCVVWDAANSRWTCFYAETLIRVAVSTDATGAPGTWLKYYNGSFSQPGIGGLQGTIPGLGNHSGGNPSVHFNTSLQRWVMVFHSWDNTQTSSGNSLWITSSADLINWDSPRLLLAASGSGRYWYPTILGPTDTSCDQVGTLLYGYWPDKAVNQRQFKSRSITFQATANPTPELSGPATVTSSFSQEATAQLTVCDDALAPGSLTLGASSSNPALVPSAGFAFEVTTPWTSTDVGAASPPGGTGEAGGGAYTVAGSGGDIFGTADAFRYMHQPLSGDGTVTMRITAFDTTRDFAKTGLMIRKSTAANASYAFLRYTRAGGILFQWRTSDGATQSTSAGAAMTLPLWMRLVRAGNVVSAFRAADDGGIPGTWQAVGTAVTFDAGASPRVGVAVTNQINGALSTVTADQFSGPIVTGNNRRLHIQPAAGAWGNAILTVQAGDGTSTAAINIPLRVFSPLEVWRQQNLGNPDASDTADPDGDGISNLMEFALDLNPNAAQPSGLPTASASASVAKLRFKRRLLPAITYVPEWSNDLAQWHPDGFTLAPVPGTNDGTTESVDASIPADLTKFFLRLRVTNP